MTASNCASIEESAVRTSSAWGRTDICEDSIPTATAISVSYTHLDVYKRQMGSHIIYRHKRYEYSLPPFDRRQPPQAKSSSFLPTLLKKPTETLWTKRPIFYREEDSTTPSSSSMPASSSSVKTLLRSGSSTPYALANAHACAYRKSDLPVRPACSR